MNRVKLVFVVGGGIGTEHEVMHAAVERYMARGTAGVLPASGTGGVADRILGSHCRYNDEVLDNARASKEKARRLVEMAVGNFSGFFPCDMWGVDIHDGWLSGSKHPAVRYTYKIRHYGGPIAVEGE